MAKITRITQKQFGSSGPSGDFGEFGSLAAGAPNYSKDPTVIQDLAAFLTGWAAATLANNRPALEDMNSLFFLLYYQVCYVLEMGIPEWDSATTYYTDSFVQVSGTIYKSLQDDNVNQNPVTETSYWTTSIVDLSGYVALTGNQSVAGIKTFASAPVMSSGIDNQNQQITGLCVENRTDDTGCTQAGRIWLRTDV